ncbi:MAG TPA: prepilin-type N-terminal cleavage/methylation domain-containing protein [Verrucomicrobiae bacterium]|nr:prepilin-type N-terminal cleavage/methylation domain-containing protein [Verrucomicrobiae bacterium]
MNSVHTYRKRGFTLIELLIVIVIIGLLTGLATTSYISAQKNARDNARKTGVASISTAVEAFYQAKRRFPGLVGNEPAIPSTGQRTIWQGCLALDNGSGSSTTYTSILYYSYPTVTGGTGASEPCNTRNGGVAIAGFDPGQYAPFPSWIPELGEYLNPTPTEKRYQNSTGAVAPLDEAAPTLFNAANHDVLGSNSAQAFVYRRLVGGYAVYARLESGTTDTTLNVPFSDSPKYYSASTTNGVGVTVYKNNVFMIRK